MLNYNPSTANYYSPGFNSAPEYGDSSTITRKGFLSGFNTLFGRKAQRAGSRVLTRVQFLRKLSRELSLCQETGNKVAVVLLKLEQCQVLPGSFQTDYQHAQISSIFTQLEQGGVTGCWAAVYTDSIIALLCSNITSVRELENILERLSNNFSKTDTNGLCSMYPNQVIGAALTDDASEKPETLIQQAALSLQNGCTKDECGYQIYKPELKARIARQLELETQIRNGLNLGWFKVYFQPVIALDSSELVGAEALLRLDIPGTGLVSPAEFIPVAEKTGLISALGIWVFREVCRQITDWDACNKFSKVKVGVNLSVLQLKDPHLPEKFERIIQETGVDPSRIWLEITESTMIDNIARVSTSLRCFKQMGMQIAIDDFGTGYSSLNYLQYLQADIIKIDHSFTRCIGIEKGTTIIVQKVIELGKALGMQIVAEGVEDQETQDLLIRMGCDKGQGYYYGRPALAILM